jgi:DNA-directed RNA polymerase I, II, and III subunit RPABC1
MSEIDANKTTKAIETLKEMITQRGYAIEDSNDMNTDDDMDDGIQTITGTRLYNKKLDKIIIFATPISKFNVDRVKEFVSILNTVDINHCICVYTDTVTSMAQKLIENTTEFQIELFTLQELQYNITKHILVPTHICLTDEESKEFRKQFGIRFPVILTTDPVCKFYNFKRGGIIKIIRKSNDNEYITQRIVK